MFTLHYPDPTFSLLIFALDSWMLSCHPARQRMIVLVSFHSSLNVACSLPPFRYHAVFVPSCVSFEVFGVSG